jgi:hypothetical protein
MQCFVTSTTIDGANVLASVASLPCFGGVASILTDFAGPSVGNFFMQQGTYRVEAYVPVAGCGSVETQIDKLLLEGGGGDFYEVAVAALAATG